MGKRGKEAVPVTGRMLLLTEDLRGAVQLINALGTKAVSLTIRDTITDVAATRSLSSGASVTSKAIGDCSIVVSYEGYNRTFAFPYPVRGKQHKTRIARKSSYIEIESFIRSNFEDFLDLSLNPFPVTVIQEVPNLLNAHYLKLSALPALDLTSLKSAEWLRIHVGMSISTGERQHSTVKKPEEARAEERTLIDVKQTLQIAITQFAEKRQRIIGLINPNNRKGLHTLFFMNDIRLDLGAHTVVADACVVPLTESLVEKAKPLLYHLSKTRGFLPVNTLDEEVKALRKLLPLFAERCRTWKHTEKCEYLLKGIPAALDGFTQSPLCSCGKGKDLGAFGMAAQWKVLHSEATRVAISPLFTFSFMEDVFAPLTTAMGKGPKSASKLKTSFSPVPHSSSMKPTSPRVQERPILLFYVPKSPLESPQT
ncbi:unnamed protein product [Cyclocybe aegerita]|uniref:Uncharacterized protein n=1 Tax=Cyclocybe aegerita TaxID=1973307 RepID=A0A8S0XKD6_CYCAE|nr:unnamed protein product [Cyclocybe aegerita]